MAQRQKVYTTRTNQVVTLKEEAGASTSIHIGVNKMLTMYSFDKVAHGMGGWVFNGEYLQDALGFLSAEIREFLLTGYTPEKRREIFGASEEDFDA